MDPFSSFKTLDIKGRKKVTLNFWKIANQIPAIFYPRLAVAFFIVIDIIRTSNQESEVSQEISLWLETWYNMLKSSLECSVNTHKSQPLHHILCALMLSTKNVHFIASFPDHLVNIVHGLEKICENSTGRTEKWVSILLTELQQRQ